MLFEEASRNPLVNGIPNIFNEFANSSFVFLLGSFNGLEEELDETFQGILIHVINDAKGNTQEIKHGTFCSHWPIYLSLSIDVYLCFLCFFGLFLD